MNPLEHLKSVLCDPTGKCCISGSDEDRAIVDRALQALAEQLVIECDCETATSPDGSRLTKCGSDQMRRAVQEGRAFCKQPAQQEPVATLWQHGETGHTRITMPGDITDCDARWFKAAYLYTSLPAQRTWVGLTDEEKYDCLEASDCRDALCAAIEAKLKERNT